MDAYEFAERMRRIDRQVQETQRLLQQVAGCMGEPESLEEVQRHTARAVRLARWAMVFALACAGVMLLMVGWAIWQEVTVDNPTRAAINEALTQANRERMAR
jgi:hypothetical protein